MFSDTPYLLVGLITLALVVACVLFHYEGLRLLGLGATNRLVLEDW